MAKRKSNQTKGKAVSGRTEGAKPEKKPAPDGKKKVPVEGKKAALKKAGPKKPADTGPGFLTRTGQFFREVRIELRKVTWPSRKEAIASTSVVLVVVFVVAVYLGAVDIILSRTLKYLLR